MRDNSKVDNEINTPFIRGIILQRELYKQSMLEKDYVSAITAIENIKVEIKNRAKSKNMEDRVILIEKCIMWFRTIPFRYKIKTPDGNRVNLPQTIELMVLNRFNKAYENIIIILNALKML